jgi:hypothetical protein
MAEISENASAGANSVAGAIGGYLGDRPHERA